MHQKNLTIKKIFNLALQTHQKNNFKVAENLYNKILKIDPNNFQTIFLLGTLSTQISNFKKAKYLLTKVVKIQPNHFDAHNNLGIAFKGLGEYKNAMNSYQKALSIKPMHAPAYNNIGNIFKEIGEYNNAIQAYEKAIQIKSSYADAHNNLGLIFQKMKEFTKASNAFQKAIRIMPTHIQAYKNLGNIFKEQGKFKKAIEFYQKAIKYEPEDFLTFYYLSDLEKKILNLKLKKKINKCLKDKKQTNINIAYGNFLLSRYEVKTKNHEKELKYLIKGHDYYFKSNKDQFEKQLKYWLKELPNSNKLLNLSAPNNKDNYKIKPIFIVGLPRCGSTLIEKIIASGEKYIPMGEETEIINFFVKQEITQNQSIMTKIEILQEKIINKYKEKNLVNADSDYTFTDKSLDNFFYIDLIKMIFPNAKVINCKRNSLSSIISILKNNLTGLPWAHNLNHIFEYFNIYFTIIEKFKKKYPNYIYELELENFVKNPIAESKKLLNFCNLKWDKKCLKFYKRKDLTSQTASNIQIRKAIYKDKLNKYSPYKKMLNKYKNKYDWYTQN